MWTRLPQTGTPCEIKEELRSTLQGARAMKMKVVMVVTVVVMAADAVVMRWCPWWRRRRRLR